jgi:hypothetical protein
MSPHADEPHGTAAASGEHVAASIGVSAAAEALRHGPRGALLVGGIAVTLLFLGWLAFYFLLFLPRGPIG